MSDDEAQMDLFEEPEGYYPSAPPHTFETCQLTDGRQLKLRLVGKSPLWGHHLWQGATIVAGFLERHSDQYLTTRSVLELGAGAGLPSLIAAIGGASCVVITDYPENQLIENIQYNVDHCLPRQVRSSSKVVAQGYLWGADTRPLLHNLQDRCSEGFDTLILADLLFNHACHRSLLNTIIETLKRAKHASALVFFTPYRPWLYEKDLAFFRIVREDGRFQIDELGQWIMDRVMFENDQGDETLRRTVFGFEIRWCLDTLQGHRNA